MAVQVGSLKKEVQHLMPGITKYELLLQELSSCDLTWDDAMPKDLDKNAKEVFEETLNNHPVGLRA